jgi:hypothetical protein
MEDSNAALIIIDRVCMLLFHHSLARSVSRVENTQSAWLLLDFFSNEVLVHFVKAVIHLVHNHMVLQHVLILGDADHSLHELLRRQTGELLRNKLLFLSTAAVGNSALLVGSPLQNRSILLAEFTSVVLFADADEESTTLVLGGVLVPHLVEGEG